MAKSEYTRLRDIAQKRLGRLEASGLAMPGLSFPKLRELKTEAEKKLALKAVREFVEAPTKVKEVRQTGQNVLLTERGIRLVDPEREARLQRRRDAARSRREVLAGLTKEQRSMIKGALKLGITIRTKDIPAFIEYMEYRFSQYSDSQFYLFADYSEDYGKIKNRHKVREIVNDFKLFQQSYIELHEKKPGTSYSAQEFQSMWSGLIDWKNLFD